MPIQAESTRFSVRKSIAVWVTGAVFGWVIAVVVVYNLVGNPDAGIAENDPGAETGDPERSLAAEDPADRLTPEELEALTGTAPAAGAEPLLDGEADPAEDEDAEDDPG